MTSRVELILNSKNRSSGTVSEPKFVLQDIPSRLYRTIQLKALVIPQTYYNVTSNNNTLNWVDGTAATVNSTITAGNYSITEFLTKVENVLNTDKAGGDTNTYTVSLGATTEKVTISGSATNFQLTWATSTINPLLGFDETNDTGASSYTGSYTANMKPSSKFIYVETDLPIKGMKYMVGENNYKYIASIATSNYGDILYSMDPLPMLLETRNLSAMSFSIRDEDHNVLDLNGNHWSMELIIN